jgi:hypothetical protein
MLSRLFAQPLETYRKILEVFVQKVMEKLQAMVLNYTRIPDVLSASVPLERKSHSHLL